MIAATLREAGLYRDERFGGDRSMVLTTPREADQRVRAHRVVACYVTPRAMEIDLRSSARVLAIVDWVRRRYDVEAEWLPPLGRLYE